MYSHLSTVQKRFHVPSCTSQNVQRWHKLGFSNERNKGSVGILKK